jgi:hypothetical protein
MGKCKIWVNISIYSYYFGNFNELRSRAEGGGGRRINDNRRMKDK